MDEKKVEEIFKNSQETQNEPIGLFYKLYDKERLYHEEALYKFLTTQEYSKKVVENLLASKQLDINQYDLKVHDLTKEKTISDDKRIDLFFTINRRDSSLRTAFVLELKTGTDNHDGQLTAYVQYFDNQEKGKYEDILFFYVSLNGKEPILEGEDKNCVSKYLPCTYKDLVKEIEINNDREIKDFVIFDYIKTIDIVSSTSPSPDELFTIYKTYFRLLKDEFKEIEFSTKLIYSATEKKNLKGYIVSELIESENLEFNPKWCGVCLTLKIEKKNSGASPFKLAIERRWEKRKDEWQHSMYYGINEGKSICQNSVKYDSLIDYWLETKRVTGVEKRKPVGYTVDRKNTFNHVNTKQWYVVQYLTGWLMPLIDNLQNVYELSYYKTWSEWIKSEFELLDNSNSGKANSFSSLNQINTAQKP